MADRVKRKRTHVVLIPQVKEKKMSIRTSDE